MTINEATKKYRLPNPTTPEDLECRWSKILTFGDKIVMAGHYYNGQNRPCYFGAAYEFLTDDHTCEGIDVYKRQVENGIPPEDIFVERNGEKMMYSDLVKEVEVPVE